MVGKVLTGNGSTAYGNGAYSLIGGVAEGFCAAVELSDATTWPKASMAQPLRDALLQLFRERQDHLLFVIQGAHGGTPGQQAMLASRSIVHVPLNQRVNGETKGRKITRHGFPYLLQIHTQVIMNQNISHAGDGLPRSGRFGLAKISRQILHGFADHDQVTDHSILHKRGNKKG